MAYKPILLLGSLLFLGILILYILPLSQTAHVKSLDDADGVTASLKKGWTVFSTSWPRYRKTTQILKALKKSLPHNIDLYSIGKTVQGRDMWVIKLGADLKKDRPLLTTPVKLVANMHGDETLGRALLLMFAVDILTKYREGDTRAKNLLENTELHFLYSMNTDGYEAAPEGSCAPNSNVLGRRNANEKDLNRDFPDQFTNSDLTTWEELLDGRQPETQNVMKWIITSYFVLSANLHALTLVASYPFDSVPVEMENDPNYTGAGVISRSPDHRVFFNLATLYATNHKYMSIENNCSQGEFEGGVTNGAKWYNVRGGMQDFNYFHSNTFDVTFELSCCKFPASETLLDEWDANSEALWAYVEASHWGIMGLVRDSENGNFIKGATIHVKEINHTVSTTHRGEYWRLLVPGRYSVWVEAEGYHPSNEVDVVVKHAKQKLAQRYDFNLTKEMAKLTSIKLK